MCEEAGFARDVIIASFGGQPRWGSPHLKRLRHKMIIAGCALRNVFFTFVHMQSVKLHVHADQEKTFFKGKLTGHFLVFHML